MNVHLFAEDVETLARGATFLSSGGGGATRLAALLARRELQQSGPVELLSPDQFQEQFAIVGLTGAPQIDNEKLPSGTDLEHAVRALGNIVGAIHAIGAFEIGGSNALFPVVAASRLGLPLLDADAMGRSFPGTTMSTVFTNQNVNRPFFVVFADAHGRFSLVPGADRTYVERMAASMNKMFGGVSACAIGPFATQQSAKDTLICGSFTRALRIGRVLAASKSPNDIYNGLEPRDVGLFYVGKVVRMMESRANGRIHGVCVIETHSPEHLFLRLDYQNEYLVLSSDGDLLTTTPDIITVMDAQTLQPIHPEELAYSREVAIFTVPAPAFWKQEEHETFVDMSAFGYFGK